MCMVKDMGIDTLGHKTWGQGWENKGNAYAHGDRQADREGTEGCCNMEYLAFKLISNFKFKFTLCQGLKTRFTCII